MWKKFFNRFLIFSLTLVFTFVLSVPAFAAGGVYPMPGYTFLFEETFPESSFVADGDNYKVPAFTASYKLEKSDACIVSFCGQNVELPWFGYSSDQYSLLYCIGNVSLIDPTQSDNGHGFFLALDKSDRSKCFFVCSSEFYHNFVEGTGSEGFSISVSVLDESGMTFLEKLLAIFSDIGEWLRSQVDFIINMFWDSATSQLTFFGVLSLISLGFSLALLLVKVILNFLNFRG